MPTNKNAQIRFRILDNCLKDRYNKYTFDDLLEQVNEAFKDLNGQTDTVSVRTLRNDLRIIEDSKGFGMHVRRDYFQGRKCYYRYADQSKSIYNSPLSIEDIDNLNNVLDMLDRYRGNPHYAWVEEVVMNLQHRFGLKPNPERLVSFEQNEQLKGLEFLSKLIDYTIQHDDVEIVYQSFKGEEQRFMFSPYFVKQYNNRWFIFGRKKGETRIINLALDRINKAIRGIGDFEPNKDIDFNTYFDDVIGVTKRLEYEAETIRLKFTKDRFPYVVNKPIHKSQVIVDDEPYTIELTLRYNLELESNILYFGPDVEILEPEWLRNRIIKKIKENLDKYKE